MSLYQGRSRSASSGFSLLEMAVAIALMGVLFVVSAHLLKTMTKKGADDTAAPTVKAERLLVGSMAVANTLPPPNCVDRTGSQNDCLVPWNQLGVSPLGDVGYQVDPRLVNTTGSNLTGRYVQKRRAAFPDIAPYWVGNEVFRELQTPTAGGRYDLCQYLFDIVKSDPSRLGGMAFSVWDLANRAGTLRVRTYSDLIAHHGCVNLFARADDKLLQHASTASRAGHLAFVQLPMQQLRLDRVNERAPGWMVAYGQAILQLGMAAQLSGYGALHLAAGVIPGAAPGVSAILESSEMFGDALDLIYGPLFTKFVLNVVEAAEADQLIFEIRNDLNALTRTEEEAKRENRPVGELLLQREDINRFFRETR